MPRGEVVGLILVVVLIGLAFPVLMNASSSPKKYFVEIPENETQRVAGEVNITVTEANLGANSTVRVVDLETLESSEKTIQDGEKASYSFSPGNVTVGVNETSSRGTRMNVGIRASYSWEERARTIGGRLPLVLAALAVIVVVIGIGVAAGGLV